MQNDILLDNEDEIEIDVVLLVKELLAHWVLIAVSAILVGGIFFTTSKFLITPQYTSTSSLYVLNNENSTTSLADIQIGSNLLKDYQEIAKSRIVLTTVIEELGLDESYEQLLGKLTVSNRSERILFLTIKDTDPERAKEIVDKLSDVMINHVEDKMDQKALTILEYGYVNPQKVSPKNMKNGLTGAIGGFLIAALTIAVSFLMNDKINTTDDIEKRLGINVLGLLPYEDFHDENNVISNKKRSKKKR